MASVLPVAEILARQLPIAWYEGVAIIQEVCDAYDAEALLRADARLAGPDRIEITSRGEVRIGFASPARSRRESVAAPTDDLAVAPIEDLARLLGTLVGESSPPAPLRLLISQACSAPAAFPSVSAFSRALKYFERPGRIEIIRTVHARLQDKGGPSPEAASPGPLPQPETIARAPRGRDMMGVTGIWLVLTVVIAMLASVAPSSPSFRARFRSTRNVAASTIVSGVRVTRGWARRGLDRTWQWTQTFRSSGPASGSNAGLSANAGRKPRGRRTSANGTFGGSPDAGGVARGATPAPRGRSPVASGTAGTASRNDSPGEPGAGSRGLASTLASAPVYTPADRDVTEPILLGSPLPEASRDHEIAGLGNVELLINEAGAVESVKLRSPASRFQDRMMLSAIKAWRFRPALRDGRPVKFRKTVQLTYP